MTRQEFFQRIAAHRSELARAGVLRLGVFGSAARGEAGLDILVEFDSVPDLYEFAALRGRLAQILGRPVDLTTPQTLKPRLRARILDEVRYARERPADLLRDIPDFVDKATGWAADPGAMADEKTAMPSRPIRARSMPPSPRRTIAAM